MDTILVIDDEEDLCLSIKKVLQGEGYQVCYLTDPGKLPAFFSQRPWSCVLLDLNLEGQSGIDCLAKIKEWDANLPVVMITAYDTVRTAVEAMKKGAFHYLAKPFDNDELKALIANAVKTRHLYWELERCRRHDDSSAGLEQEMGHSTIVGRLIQQVVAVAKTEVTVLLTGESGTGKELVSRGIHDLSRRAKGRFVPVDCASIPESLIESELFGHEKGAFTGSHSRHIGKIEQAEGGTLFLDEISNIPFAIQAKLLRFLEGRVVERLGGGGARPVSIRVVAASNRDLRDLVTQGRFRDDLYHRLNEFPIQLPSLRDRLGDIPYLAMKWLGEFESQMEKKFSGISDEALQTLQRYPWPGNIRELRNVIKRAMVIAEGRIEKNDLPEEIRKPTSTGICAEVAVPLRFDLPLLQASKEATTCIERKLIEGTLRRTEWRKGKAAQLLGVDEKTLYNKLKEYKIGFERF